MNAVDILVNVLVPLAMFVVMAIIGLDLSMRDFRRVLLNPRPLLGGTIMQITLLPLLGAVIVSAVPLSAAEIGALIIIAACPGGGLSNIMTAKARGSVALSVSYTGLTSILALASIPAITYLGFQLFLDKASVIAVPVVPMIAQLLLLVFTPICTGMWLRDRYPDVIRRHYQSLNRCGNVLIFIIIAMSLTVSHGVTVTAVFQATPIAIGFSLGSLLVGLVAARLLRLSREERIALLIEFCVRNAAIATLIIVVILKKFEMVALLAACAIVQAVVVLLVTLLLRLFSAKGGDFEPETHGYVKGKEWL